MKAKRILAVSCFMCLLLALVSVISPARAADEPGRAVLDKMLTAIEQNNYPVFIADGTPLFKESLKEAQFKSVSSQLAPRMKEGYSVSYLGELNQQGACVLLYKLSFDDKRDDVLVKFVLQDGKVAGFWLQ